MTPTSDTRLTEMESRLAHHERMTEDVSAVLAEQGRAIDALTLRLRRLTGRIAELEAGGGHSPPDDQPPPHY
jgi:SlyX protein